MNITLVSLDNLGMNAYIAATLEKQGHIVNHINFKYYNYKYPSILHKAYNFILKAFFKTNLKHQHHGNEIIKELQKNNQVQDVILTIKGDFIDPKSILEFRKYGKKTIAFFNDNTYRCPNIKRVIPCFDEVYSFEKEDCEKFDLKFAPNWIYTSKDENANKNNFEYDVFTIGSIDKRLPILVRIAEELKSKQINFKFITYSKKRKTSDDNITYINKFIPLSEVDQYISRSKVLLDINRACQIGLTFRVFESLGLEKKLITTNSDIKNYDFYNPNNILVIDEKNPVIDADFFANEYEKIPEIILNKYTLEGWVNNVIFKK
ncbi:hypothetical protein [Flavobacterium sp. FlaQc-47]|uniref:hypothetical protein n=1 Tax=Flavobacterium sp. FlaQc-47 TaxID=3374180 RepID=UPI00375716BC